MIQNKRLRRNIVEYQNWLAETDFLWNRFNSLTTALENFILDVLSDESFAIKVASKFEDVLSRCDEIDYSENETAIAYCILHFLPRYRMFQMIYSKLITENLLPLKIKKNPVRTLDIGTGPGPSMYALSDLYSSLQIFGGVSFEFQQTQDYVEQSIGFRNILHHFTEVANADYRCDEIGWNVPYHHGSFEDFISINFNPMYSYWGFPKIIRFRFNLITSSNFFTTVGQVENQKNEITDCVRYLRHNGIFLVVGAKSEKSTRNDKNYSKIYSLIKQLVTTEDYSTRSVNAWAKPIEIPDNIFSINSDDRFGKRIVSFYNVIIRNLSERKIDEYIPIRVREKILEGMHPNYQFNNRCEINVFRKIAIPKHIKVIKTTKRVK